MSKHLNIGFLGAFQATLNDEPLTTFESDKVRALLAYLVIERDRPHRRDKLAALLWPDWPDRSARTNLRNALANLRSAIGDREASTPFLLITREAIQFNAASNFHLDIEEFTALSEAEDCSDWETAVGLYQGSFLEGFSLKESAPFEDWHLLNRERLQRVVASLLERLSNQHEGNGDFKAAIHYSRTLVELEPWQEEAHQRLMVLLAHSGKRGAALAQFENCRRQLELELGIPPSAETVELFEQIRDGDLAAPAVPVADQAPAPGAPPFKGLQYFETADAHLFFGREQQTARLLERLDPRDGERFLAVVGSSGSGKSSLVRAGLIPALKSEAAALPGAANWPVHIFSPGSHPLESLAINLAGQDAPLNETTSLIDDLARDPRCLNLYIRRILPKSSDHLLLVVDQFEELFTQCRSQSERQAFVENLMNAVKAQGPAIIVITLRADFYAHCGDYASLRRALERRQVYIGPMIPTELRHAVEEPARQNGWTFEPGLVDLLLQEVGNEPGALPLLSHALLETWQRRRGKMMTLAGYNESGGVRGAISRTAERVLHSLEPEGQTIARNIFLRLTELGAATQETRRRASLAELVQRPDDTLAVEQVLRTLVDARLVITDKDTVEVAHEALIREWPTLREWLEEDAEGLRIHRHLTDAAQEWDRLAHDPGELYRGARLAAAQEWAEQHEKRMNTLEQEFLAASRQEVERREQELEAQRQRELEAARQVAESERQRAEEQARSSRRLRTGAFGLAVLSLFAIILAVVAFNARATAQREAAVNHSLVLSDEAVEVDEAGNVDLALALALAAVDMEDPPADSFRNLTTVAEGMGTRLVLEGHNGPVRAGAFSPGSLLAVSGGCLEPASDSSCIQGELILWDLAAGSEMNRWPGHEGWVTALEWVVPEDQILSGGEDGTLILWAADSLDEMALWDAHDGPINALAISPDGMLAASAGADNAIVLLDLEEGKIVQRLFGHTAAVFDVTFSPDGKQLLSGSADTTMILWDAASGQAVQVFEGHQSTINDVAFTPDGTQILSASSDLSLRLWDAATGEELQIRETLDSTEGMALSPDGHTVFRSVSQIIYTWDLQDFNGRHRKLTYSLDSISRIYDLKFSPDGRLALSAGEDGALRIWNLAGASEIQQIALGFPPTALDLIPGTRLVAVGGWENGGKIFDLDTGQPGLDLSGVTSIIAPGAISVSGDGRWIAGGSGDYDGDTNAGSLIVWDAVTGKTQCDLREHIIQLRSVAFSPDSRHLLAGTQLNDIEDLILWDVETCSLVRSFDTQQDTAGMAFSKNGRFAVTASAFSANVSLWDIEQEEPIGVFSLPGTVFLDADFGPDDATILGASFLDGTIIEWDRESGEILRRFMGHDDGVLSVELSPDGQRFVSTDNTGMVIVWDMTTGEAVQQNRVHNMVSYHATFSEDGQTVYAVSGDTTLSIWQLGETSFQALRDWIEANRYVRDLTCEEREQYGIEPLCR